MTTFTKWQVKGLSIDDLPEHQREAERLGREIGLIDGRGGITDPEILAAYERISKGFGSERNIAAEAFLRFAIRRRAAGLSVFLHE